MACKSVFIINGQVFELALDSSQTPESSFNVEDLALAFTLEENKEKISEIQEALKVELNSIEKKVSKKINPCTEAKGGDICDSAHCQVYSSKDDILKKWGEENGQRYWEKIKK